MSKNAIKVPEGFNIKRSLLLKLPDNESGNAAEILWEKSNGRCAICNQPLPDDGSEVEVDHRMPSRKEKAE